MFQYTTETIINANVGNLDGGKRFLAVTEANGDKSLLIDGVGYFKKACVKAVYKRAYVAPVKEKAVITVPAPSAIGAVVRLKVELTQEGLVSAIYKDAYRVSKKPLFFEIVASSTSASDAADAFEKVIKREMDMTDVNLVVASVAGAALTLEAKDCYTRIASINIDEVVTSNTPDAHTFTGYEDFASKLSWKREDGSANGVVLTKGSEGAGTVARLIKDLRVPTDANTDPFASDNGGKPVPGGKYTQYTIEYVTNSRHIAGGVVGELSQSLTSHILFIESAAVSDFESALSSLSLTISPAIPANSSDDPRTAKIAADQLQGAKQ